MGIPKLASEQQVIDTVVAAGYEARTASCLLVSEAETWLIDPPMIVRVTPLSEWSREQAAARTTAVARDAGIPAPGTFTTVADEFCYTLTEHVTEVDHPMGVRMWTLGSLLAQVHQIPGDSMREWGTLDRKARQLSALRVAHGHTISHLVEGLWDQAVSAFRQSVVGRPQVLIHGDAHLANLLCGTEPGEGVLIDWEDAGAGTVDAELRKLAVLSKRYPKMRPYLNRFWDGYGSHPQIVPEAERLQEVAAVIWAGALTGKKPGAADEFAHRMDTLDIPDAEWNVF